MGETIGEEACLGAGRQKTHAHAVPSQVRYMAYGTVELETKVSEDFTITEKTPPNLTSTYPGVDVRLA